MKAGPKRDPAASQAALSEADLVDRAYRGDSGAWESLVHMHQEAMLGWRICFWMTLPSRHRQEAFIRAYKALDRFDTARPLRPWLMSICANLARNRRRALGRQLIALHRLVKKDANSAVSVEDRSAQRWQAQTLRRAVQRLSQNDQQVIYLRYFLDMSVEETANALDVAAGTIKSRLHRALDRLQAVVEQDFPSLKDALDG
jgi:RNA polymerase sigma-70 factor (ECF subfamily)